MAAEYYYFGKPRLPRGYSHPIKRGELDRMLDDSHVLSVKSVMFCRCSEDGRVLTADYHGPRRKHEECGLQLTIYAVASKQRHVIHDALFEKVFPRLVTWIRTFDRSDTTLSKTDHFIQFFIRNGIVDLQQE